MDLAQVLNQHQSPKDRLGYAQLYATLLSHRRSDPLTILEIEPHPGSLLAWAEYFPAAQIIGLSPDYMGGVDHPRIQLLQCTPSVPESVAEFKHRQGTLMCDLIIDTGGPEALQILRAFYSYLKPDGLYIIEGVTDASQIHKYPSLVGCMCQHASYFFVGLSTRLCVIHNHQLESVRETY